MADYGGRKAETWRDEVESRRRRLGGRRTRGMGSAPGDGERALLVPRRSQALRLRGSNYRLPRQLLMAVGLAVLLFVAARLPFGIGQGVQKGLRWIADQDVDLSRIAAGGQTLLTRWTNGVHRLREIVLPGDPTAVPAEGPAWSPDMAPTQWAWPLQGEIGRGFGWHETVAADAEAAPTAAPAAGQRFFQPGLQIMSPGPGPVRAAAAGRVTAVQNLGEEGGWLIAIEHGGGWVTRYGGLDVAYVEEGAVVEAGQMIATLAAVGDDLHELYFEMEIDGVPVDPEPKLRRTGTEF